MLNRFRVFLPLKMFKVKELGIKIRLNLPILCFVLERKVRFKMNSDKEKNNFLAVPCDFFCYFAPKFL